MRRGGAPGGGRALTWGLAIGLVLCASLAVGVFFWSRQEIAGLARERDAAHREVQRLSVAAAVEAARAASAEQAAAAARAERDEAAQLVAIVRQNPSTGRDIKDPVLPASITGKRLQALAAAFALKQEKVPFKWGGRKREEGVDSVGFAAVALAQAGMLLRPDAATAKSLQQQLPPTMQGEPQPGDLLFFDGSIVLFYLGGDNAIGMLPEGPVTKGGVLKGKGIGFKYLGYGSINY